MKRPWNLFTVLFALPVAIAACETENTPSPAGPPPSCAGKGGCITTVIGTGHAGLGDDDVAGWQSGIYSPQDSVIGPDGKLYYLDWNNHRVRTWDPATLQTTTIVGTGEIGDLGHGGPALSARLNHPTGLLFDGVGRLMIAAWHNSRIKRVDLKTGILENICGTGARAFGGDGEKGGAMKAKLDLPSSMAFDSQGNLYISDQANARIRKVDTEDTVTTVVGDIRFVDAAGQPLVNADGHYVNFKGECYASKDKALLDAKCQPVLDKDGKPMAYTGPVPAPDLAGGFGGDGGPALAARIDGPKGQAGYPASRIFVDKSDKLYIADTNNHRIRVVDLKTGVIDTLAGNGKAGYAGDGGDAKAAQINAPTDVDGLPDGSVLIADRSNHCIRIVKDGKIDTYAGQCGQKGFAGDGGAARSAKLSNPYGIHVDPTTGALYIADTYNHRMRIVTK